MCGGPNIPAQDPRFAEASLDQVNLAKQQYSDYVAPGGDRDWMRSTTGRALDIYSDQAQRSAGLQDYQLSAMKRNDDRYWNVGVPYEDKLIDKIDQMDSPAYRDQQAGLARGDVEQSYRDSVGQTVRNFGRYGMNMDSPAAVLGMQRMQRDKMLAMATAATKTRMAAEQAGLSNRMQMYGGMRGLAGLGATSAQLAMGAGGAAGAAAGGMTGAVGSSLNANNAAFGAYSSGVSAGVGGYNNYYSNSINKGQVEASNDPGNMILGAVTGGLTRWATGKIGG
jgi:hypothetical protein